MSVSIVKDGNSWRFSESCWYGVWYWRICSLHGWQVVPFHCKFTKELVVSAVWCIKCEDTCWESQSLLIFSWWYFLTVKFQESDVLFRYCTVTCILALWRCRSKRTWNSVVLNVLQPNVHCSVCSGIKVNDKSNEGNLLTGYVVESDMIQYNQYIGVLTVNYKGGNVDQQMTSLYCTAR